jgi:hypothetical protein
VVEAAVVEPADVGHEPDLLVALAPAASTGLGGARARRRAAAAAAAGRDQDDDDAEDCERALHHDTFR